MGHKCMLFENLRAYYKKFSKCSFDSIMYPNQTKCQLNKIKEVITFYTNFNDMMSDYRLGKQ